MKKGLPQLPAELWAMILKEKTKHFFYDLLVEVRHGLIESCYENPSYVMAQLLVLRFVNLLSTMIGTDVYVHYFSNVLNPVFTYNRYAVLFTNTVDLNIPVTIAYEYHRNYINRLEDHVFDEDSDDGYFSPTPSSNGDDDSE